MTTSYLTRHLATLTLALCLPLTAGAVTLTLLARGHPAPDDVRLSIADAFGQVALLAFAIVGALIARKRPANPIGWLFCGLGVWWSAYVLADAWVAYAHYAVPGALPASRELAWLANGKGALGTFITAALTPLLYPNGRLPSRRWRVVAWLAAVGLAGQFIAYALDPGELIDYPGVRNPLALDGAREFVRLLHIASAITTIVAVVGACAAAIVRLRRAKGVERKQLEWFAWAAALVVAMFIVATALNAAGVPSVVGGALVIGAILALPITTGVAILRHRLYDIDRLINRTLVYAFVTAGLAGAYALAVVVLQRALGPLTDGSDAVVAGSTLLVAALFRPLRARAQRVVDRRFYRHAYDPERVLEVFSRRLREEIDLDAVTAELLAVVHETMQPEHVTVWLRR